MILTNLIVVFNLKKEIGDAKQILLVNENRFDWFDSEIPRLLLETGLTGIILKFTLVSLYVFFPFHHLENIDPQKAKEASVKLVIMEI